MKIDFDKIIDEAGLQFSPDGSYYRTKEAMRKACEMVLDEAIKSFPSHEHPGIAKSILKIKEEL